MNLPVAEAGGEVLVVSQFTLYGDTRKGRRPSWAAAARPEQAEPLIERFSAALAGLGARVATGRFAAHMRGGAGERRARHRHGGGLTDDHGPWNTAGRR